MTNKKRPPLTDLNVPVAFHLGDLLAAYFGIDCALMDPTSVVSEADKEKAHYMSYVRWPKADDREAPNAVFLRGARELMKHMVNIPEPAVATREDIRAELVRQHPFLKKITAPHGFSHWADATKREWLQTQVDKHGTWHTVTPLADIKKNNLTPDAQSYSRSWFPNLTPGEVERITSQYREIEQAIVAASKLGGKKAYIGPYHIEYGHDGTEPMIFIKTTDPDVHNARYNALERVFKNAGLSRYIYPGYIEHETEQSMDHLIKIRAGILLKNKQDLLRLRDQLLAEIDLEPLETWARTYGNARPLSKQISRKDFAALKKLKYEPMAEVVVMLSRLNENPVSHIDPNAITEITTGPESEHHLIIRNKSFEESRAQFEALEQHFYDLGWHRELSFDCRAGTQDDGSLKQEHYITINVGSIVAREKTESEPHDRPAMRRVTAAARALFDRVNAEGQGR